MALRRNCNTAEIDFLRAAFPLPRATGPQDEAPFAGDSGLACDCTVKAGESSR